MELSKNYELYDRSKHIERKYHYVKDIVQYVLSSRHVTNVLTKPPSKSGYFRDKLSVVENASLAEKECER